MKKFELTTIQGKDVFIDISQLLKEEVLYVNATSLAKQFGKNRRQLEKFLKTNTFIEYEKALFKVIQKGDFKTDGKGLRYSIKGKYGGTYLHSDLLMIFLRWLNPKFAIKCDLYIKNKIQEVRDEKSKAAGRIESNKENKNWCEARDHGKDTRKQFTEKVKAFCNFAEEERREPYDECPYYKDIPDAIYDYVGVPIPKNGQSPRDIYTAKIVEVIEAAEVEVIELLDEWMIDEEELPKDIKALIVKRLTHEVGNSV